MHILYEELFLLVLVANKWNCAWQILITEFVKVDSHSEVLSLY